MPGLDGLRAVAVLAVIAYHLGFGWAPGGLLGVGVFFTLSGYLITDLLLAQMASGRMRLADFWLARARRLLPALFLMLVVVVIWVAAIGPSQSSEFPKAVAAAALYVSNWQLIFHHVSYFASFGPPSPLNHLWSLGVEEQFYIVWPLLLLLGIRVIRERSRVAGLRPRLAALALVLAAASATEMALLYHPTLDPSRVYYGTDTRAFELLAGAALAMVWPSRLLRTTIKPGARRLLDGAGTLGLLAILALVWRTTRVLGVPLPRRVRAALAGDRGRARAARAPRLQARPRAGLRPAALDRRSLIRDLPLALPDRRADHAGGRPRHRSRSRRPPGGGDLRRRGALVALRRAADPPRRARAPVAGGGGAALAPAAARRPARVRAARRRAGDPLACGRRPRRGARRRPPRTPPRQVGGRDDARLDGRRRRDVVAGPGSARRHGLASALRLLPADAGAQLSGAGATVASPGPRSSCRAVVDIGDSTSEGLTSPDYLPNPSDRIEAQYTRVGVTIQHYEISGARSIVETYDGIPNAQQVAQNWRAAGYDGCWVLALGTNDTADVYVGSNVGRLARIERMMSVIGKQPVMWVNVKSLLDSGAYSEQNMQLWDDALLDACRRYPNMRVYDWAAVAQDSWFIDDGIHYNTPGYRARSRLIAQALAHAFPASGQHSGCVVQ